MKNLCFALILAAMSAQVSAITVKIKKEGGGCNGYDKVEESHTPTLISLSCTGSGNEKCIWEYSPKIKDRAVGSIVMDAIENNIQRNNFKGGVLYVKDIDTYVTVSNVNTTENGVINYEAAFECDCK